MEEKDWKFADGSAVWVAGDGGVFIKLGDHGRIKLSPDFTIHLGHALLEAGAHVAKGIVKPMADTPGVIKSIADTAKEVGQTVNRFEEILKEDK